MPSRVEELRDEVDILEYRGGNAAALGRLISRWQARMYVYILAMVENRDEAWDVSQELWLSVTDALGGSGGIRRFTPWLYRVAHNKCVSHLRKRHRPGRGEEAAAEGAAEEGEGLDAIVVRAEDARLVREALGELSMPLREALHLSYMDGLTLEEVAGVLGVPLGTVQSRLHYGRRKLKEALTRKGYRNG